MMRERGTTVTRATLVAAVTGGMLVLVAVAAAIWTSTASVWLKLAGSGVAVLVVTAFIIRMWLISHPYGARPPREGR